MEKTQQAKVLTGLGQLLEPLHLAVSLVRRVFSDGETIDCLSFKSCLLKARENWAFACFWWDEATGLRGFFSLQFQLLADILLELDRQAVSSEQKVQDIAELWRRETHSTFDYLSAYFLRYLDQSLRLPGSYAIGQFHPVLPLAEKLTDRVRQSINNLALRSCLLDYLLAMRDPEKQQFVTLGQLAYFRGFLKGLNFILNRPAEMDMERQVNTALLGMNFNQLDFFAFYQDSVREQTIGLNSDERRMYWLKLAAQPVPAGSMPVYDTDWPNLQVMIRDWALQEVSMLPHSPQTGRAESAAVEKLPLNLSVAQVGYLLKLFGHVNLFPGVNLTAIFKFTAGHFRTRRQAMISPGSLSKEFYGVTQVTAATVRDLLLRMVARINRDFFPVWVVITLIALWR